MDRIDIYRSAALLIKRYGEDAALEAACCASRPRPDRPCPLVLTR